MRLESRNRGDVRILLLIPTTDEESRVIDGALGCKVQTNDGLIAKVTGEVRIADGYGPHYISLKSEVLHDPSSQEKSSYNI
jgi:hypothetical protein